MPFSHPALVPVTTGGRGQTPESPPAAKVAQRLHEDGFRAHPCLDGARLVNHAVPPGNRRVIGTEGTVDVLSVVAGRDCTLYAIINRIPATRPCARP